MIKKILISFLSFIFCLMVLQRLDSALGRHNSLAASAPNPYHLFAKKHLHPYYLFHLPQDSAKIKEINNKNCSIDSRGFRGTTPEEKKGKDLAFILGGSAAFGWGSSNNETTISGYLNKTQDRYHFVNAGIPSWNSLQEFYRLANELLIYKPKLILVYNGVNDSTIQFYHRKIGFIPGTPESYSDLKKAFYDYNANHDKIIKINTSNIEKIKFFPNIKSYFLQEEQKFYVQNYTLSKEESNENRKAAKVYIHNLGLMKTLCEARGISFFSIFQPDYFLHKPKNFPEDIKMNADQKEFLKEFHSLSIKIAKKENIALIDFSRIFDNISGPLSIDQLFLDHVHLSDKGNQIVASEIKSEVLKL